MTYRTRSPLALGWEAPRANALPALIIQALMVMLLVAFYTSHTASAVLLQLAELKRTHGTLFVVVASVTAGALIPEPFLIFFFQRARPSLRNFRNLLFTVPGGDSMEHLSIFCIEVKQHGLETLQPCR